MSNTSTPYDDAQRTLSVDCPSLLIPLVNEAFQTNYPLDADKVAMFRANQYERVMEEVKEIMGGKILDYEAKDIRNKGIQIGINEGKRLGIVEGITIGKETGRLEGISQNILTMYKKGKTPEEIADLLEKDLEEVKAIIAGKETTIV